MKSYLAPSNVVQCGSPQQLYKKFKNKTENHWSVILFSCFKVYLHVNGLSLVCLDKNNNINHIENVVELIKRETNHSISRMDHQWLQVCKSTMGIRL